jgi:translocation and assembly module TamA
MDLALHHSNHVASRALFALPLFVALGCASGHVKRPVRGVKVEGNQAFSDKTIVERLATRPPRGLIFKEAEEFDPIALSLDRKRVEAFYRERGYFDAVVEDVDVRPDGKGVRVMLSVVEGEPTQVAALEVTGVRGDFARGVLTREAPGLREGKRLDHPAYLLAKDALRLALVKQGHAHAEVTGVVEVHRDQRRAVVRLYADPGPLVRFGKVHVVGLKRVPERTVRARVSFDEGDVFDPEALDATEGKLYALGLFGSVRADWEHEGRPEVVDVTIQVNEGLRHEVRFGVGVGADRARWEVRGRGGYTVKGIFGSPLTTLRLDARPGYSWLRADDDIHGPSIEASASLERDDFILPRVQGVALAAYDREPRQGYILSGPRFNLGLNRAFLNDDLLHVHAGWEIRYLDFVDADPLVFGPDATAARLAYYEQRAVLDGRDVPLDARKGFYASLHLAEGGPAAGGEIYFVRGELEARGYVPLHERLTLAGRVNAGRLDAFGDDETPLPMRFYGGGGTHHRGFGFQRLSPMRRDADGDPVPTGGDDMLLGSIEARFDVVRFRKEWISTVAFLDAGDVSTPPESLDIGNLHYAAGVGLRYDTLIGPIRLDLGFRLNRTATIGADGLGNPDPGQHFAFHLSLGEAF